MSFINFKKLKQKHVDKLMKDNAHLFVVDLDKDVLWNLYLDSFPAGTNEIYRERREYDCSCCRNYVKQFGDVVSINGNKVTTMWDFDAKDTDNQLSGLGFSTTQRNSLIIKVNGHVARTLKITF